MNLGKASVRLTIATLTLCLFGAGISASETDAVTGASVDAGHHGGAEWQARHDQFAGTVTRWADELGITGQQRSDIQIISSDYAVRLGDLAKLGRDTARELLEMMPDSSEYRDKTEQASALAASSAAELVTLLAEMRAKLYSVLTPEQRDQLRAKLESLRDKKE